MTSTFDAQAIPSDLVRRMQNRAPDTGPDGAAWLRGLPVIVAERLSRWDLEVSGAAMNGHNALVLPVMRDDVPLVLKVSWPHREAEVEHVGLRHWDGRGAVRLVAAYPPDHALLLEALRVGVDLESVEIDDACGVIGSLLGRLHVDPPPTVPEFGDVVADWIAPLRSRPRTVPRRWVDRALEIYDHKSFEPRLLHLDLHFQNVLAADREPWLAIDPKPVAGPAGFDVYPALRNRVDEYGTGSTFQWQVRHRLEIVADAAGMDLDDAREWSLAHAVLNAHEMAEEGWPSLVSLHLALVKVLAEP